MIGDGVGLCCDVRHRCAEDLMKVLLWESPPDRTPSAAIIHARTSARREHYEVAGPGRRGDMLVKLAAADRIMVIGARDDSLSQFARELL